jgi:quinoprotein glucose dehydrogenase
LNFHTPIALAALLLAACSAEPPPDRTAVARARSADASAEWRSYLGADMNHFSPLTTIDPENVGRLEVAWTYDAGGASDSGYSQMQVNPLVVDGVLFGISPTLRLFALDAATGEELWSFEPDVTGRPWTSSRGVSYWEEGDERRIFFGATSRLYAIDPRTGHAIDEFGQGGFVDLEDGLGREVDDMMGVVLTTPGTVFEDLLIVGGRVNELAGAAPGHVRAFDVRTGEQRWIFHTIPHPGEFGWKTWPPAAWKTSGGANAWAGITVDRDRGLAFVPTGSASPDFFGGDRLGDNLFANCLIALDARTGERRWHYQFVRHDLWDRDLPAPPNLVEIERAGERISAVAQVTKTGDTFVFHRETGEPLFEIAEIAVPASDIPGEVAASHQPTPLLPPPFVRRGIGMEDLGGESEEERREIRTRVAGYDFGERFPPPSARGAVISPGTDGGAEWGGAAWDPTSGLLFVNGNQTASIIRMIEVDADDEVMLTPGGGYMALCASCHGLDLQGDGGGVPSLLGLSERLGPLETYRIVRDGRGRMPGFGGVLAWWQAAAVTAWVYTADREDAPDQWAPPEGEPSAFVHTGYQDLRREDGRPATRPPWRTLTAIDLAEGRLQWQIALGDYPETLATGRSGLGAENYGGPVVTASGLLFIAATPDARIRAFDAGSGRKLWEADLPAPGFATPSVYEAAGRQFLVVAAGGGKLRQPSSGTYVAFALPEGVRATGSESQRVARR